MIFVALLFILASCKKEEPGASSSKRVRTVSEQTLPGESNTHVKLSLPDTGYDVFKPSALMSYDYSYGSSMMLREDGSIDAWFSSPGDGTSEFDWITYRHSEDGSTWSDERVVLSPTPGSRDSLSTCDPDVFYYKGYYYMGYTSTIDSTFNGLCNSVFLARSTEPGGPYEKWDGEGWGKEPAPLVYYDGFSIGWGCGEPSFVVMGDRVFMYSTRDSYSMEGKRVKVTEVRSADLSSPSWPGSLVYEGVAADRSDGITQEDYEISDCDSWDVAYVEELGRFVAVCTNRRFTNESSILYYDSTDGVTFDLVSEINTNVCCGCHNCGIMGDENGHIKPGDRTLIGYAYSGNDNYVWGKWATRFAALDISEVEGIDLSEEGRENIKLSIETDPDSRPHMMMLSAEYLINNCSSTGFEYLMDYYWLDQNHTRHQIDADDILVEGYDDKVITADRGRVVSAGTGVTRARISYNGVSREIVFACDNDSVSQDAHDDGAVAEVFAPVEKLDLELEPMFATAIRPLVRTGRHELKEITADQIGFFGISFSSSDEKVCLVGDDGGLIPKSPGKTVITAARNGKEIFSVEVNVKEKAGHGV